MRVLAFLINVALVSEKLLEIFPPNSNVKLGGVPFVSFSVTVFSFKSTLCKNAYTLAQQISKRFPILACDPVMVRTVMNVYLYEILCCI